MTKTLWIIFVSFFAITALEAQNPDCVLIETTGGRLERCNEICIDLKVSNFKDILSMQFSLNWDPTVMRLTRLFQSSSPLPAYTISNNFFALNGGGVIRSFWVEPNDQGQTLADGTVLCTMCFKAVGLPGAQTDVRVVGYPLAIEFLDPDSEEKCFMTNSQPVTVIPGNKLCINTSTCGAASGANDGIISTKVDGGKPNYTVTITPGGTSNTINTSSGSTTFNNLAPGTYTITVTDANGSMETETVTVGGNPVVITTERIITPKCKGETGSILISISGGAGDSSTFGIHWMPGDVYGSKYYSRLQPGIYTVTVIDSLGCETTKSFDLTKDFFTTSLNIVDSSSCTNSLDGIAQASAKGGKEFPGGGYKFFWSQNGDDANCDPAACVKSINDSISGKNQWVIIQDANNCTDTIYYDVPSRNELKLTSTEVKNTLCPGDSSGSITVRALSNNSTDNTFTFQLSNETTGPVTTGVTTKNQFQANNLPAGRYFFSVSDTNGCTYIDTFFIGSPPPLAVNTIAIDSATSCTPGFDGFIEVGGAGGNGRPYHYLWTTGDTLPRIDSLLPGSYTVTITDPNGCSIEKTFNISGPTPPQITGFDTSHVTCTGIADGSLNVLYTEGTGTVTNFQWSNGAKTQTITQLKAGVYYVTIQDDNGCMDTDSVLLKEPAKALTLDSFRLEHPICPGESNGLIGLTVSGGTPNYTFKWSNGATTQLLVGVPAGDYTVTISDAGSCPDVVQTLTLVDPPHIRIIPLDSAMVSCNDGITCNGRYAIQAQAGKDPSIGYNFEWSSGETSFGVNSHAASQLCQGKQWVVISNSFCADTFEFEISAPEKIQLTPQTNITPPSCYGDQDASIQLDIRGGTQPYRVLWKDMNVNGFSRSNLKAGVYSFFIRDNNNCVVLDSVEVTQPDSFILSVNKFITKTVRCNGDNDGIIALVTKGGNPGSKTFTWSPNVSTDSIAKGLMEGTYFITSMDSKGCRDTLTVVLDAPPAINYVLDPIVPPLCYGDKTTIVVTQASGGNGPKFSYAVNKGETHDINESTEVFPGDYQISVFDSKGCARDTMVSIPSPRQLDITFDPPEVELELGDSATICITSDVRPEDQITWVPSGRVINNGKCIVVSDAQNNVYKAILRDKNGCETEKSINIIVINRGRVFIPNVMTQEGPNSIFKVYAGKGVRSIDFMRIYDRWGELVYEQKNLDSERDGWNGGLKNSSKKMLPGVYVYLVQVTFLNGETQLFRGDVTLLR